VSGWVVCTGRIPDSWRRNFKEFGNCPFMHRRILSQIDAGEMKAETIDRAPKATNTAECEDAITWLAQRFVDNIGPPFRLVRRMVGGRLAEGRGCYGMTVDRSQRCGDAGKNSRDSPPIRFIDSMRRGVR